MAEKGSVIDNQVDDYLTRVREEFLARTIEQALKLKYRERLANLDVSLRTTVDGKQILVINWEPLPHAPTMEEVADYINKLRKEFEISTTN